MRWPKFCSSSIRTRSTGYPPVYARDGIPVLDGYPGGQTLPTPSAIDFTPGQLLGCVSGELGLRASWKTTGTS